MTALFNPAACFVTFRETTEVGLVLSVALTFLEKAGLDHLRGQVVRGAARGAVAALLVGAGLAIAFFRFSSSAFSTGVAAPLLEGSLLLVASCALTPVAIGTLRLLAAPCAWADRLAGRGTLLAAAATAGDLVNGDSFGMLGGAADRAGVLFWLAFASVFREGLQAALLLAAVSRARPRALPIPALLGVGLGLLCSYGLLRSARALPQSRPFLALAAFLSFAVAAGLLSRGLHEFQRAGCFGAYDTPEQTAAADYGYSALIYSPAAVAPPPAWVNVRLADFTRCCAAGGDGDGDAATFFALLRSLFGYSDAPTRLEVIAYVLFWGAALGAVAWLRGTGALTFEAPPLAGNPFGEGCCAYAAAARPNKGALSSIAPSAVGVEELFVEEARRRVAAVAAAAAAGAGAGAGAGAAGAARRSLPAAFPPTPRPRPSWWWAGSPAGDAAARGDEEAGPAAAGASAPASPAAAAGGGAPPAPADGPVPAGGRWRAAAAAVWSRGRGVAVARPRACAAAAAASLALLLALPLGLLLRPPPAGPPPVAEIRLVIGRSAGASLARAPAKPQVTVNGVWPGPTFRVPYGSVIRATVVNELGGGEATAVHWHGFSQMGTPFNDGVPGFTQCPLVPTPGANTMVMEFTPDRPGTFWYHGHMLGQWPDGLYGVLVVDDGYAALRAAGAPPVFAPSEWTWDVADWYDVPLCFPLCSDPPYPAPATSMLGWYLSPASNGVEPIPDVVVVNGVDSPSAGPSGPGAIFSADPSGPPQLVRVLNLAGLMIYNASVEGMPLTVVELDSVAVSPLDVPYLVLAPGQRAVVLLDWSKLTAGPSGLARERVAVRFTALNMYSPATAGVQNSTASTLAGTPRPFTQTWAGEVVFAAAAAAAGAPPRAPPPPGAAAPAPAPAPLQAPSTLDINLIQAVPWPPQAAPPATEFMSVVFGFGSDAMGVNRAYINNQTFVQPPNALAVPLLASFMRGAPLVVPPLLSGTLTGDAVNPFVLPHGRVIQINITSLDNGPHPWHLHGHNFWLVATSDMPETETLYAPNYLRRDVVNVPALGWAAIRFVANNPGLWMLHCHIEWHMHAGLAATVVEAPSHLYAGAASGSLALPPSHAAACASYAYATTIPGSGSGAAPPPVRRNAAGSDDD